VTVEPRDSHDGDQDAPLASTIARAKFGLDKLGSNPSPSAELTSRSRALLSVDPVDMWGGAAPISLAISAFNSVLVGGILCARDAVRHGIELLSNK
jgi:hypothetical protein